MTARTNTLAAIVAGSAAIASSVVLSAVPNPQSNPKITGMWLLTPSEYERTQVPPLTPAAKAAADAARKLRESGGGVLSDNGRKCLPVGMPTMVTNEFALEILETDGRVTMLSENSSLPRSIYLNEKVHPKDLQPMWNGHSIGHWEANTLVVDTVNLNDRAVRVPNGGLASSSLHLTERYHLENQGKTLVGEMTFEDPKVLTKPWTVRHTYERMPADAELWEYACEVDAPGWSERFNGEAAKPKP
jgi:hypothetical protein